MKTIDGTVKLRIFLLGLIILTVACSLYIYDIYNYHKIYDSIMVVASKDKKLEYGSLKYSVEDVIDKVSGEVVSIVRDVNINEVGMQKVILEVEKANVTKEVPIVVEVVDTNAPVINIREDVVNVKSGISYNVFDNIISVVDSVDGNLNYKSINKLSDTEVNYYTISGTLNTNDVGIYPFEVKAVDKTGNVTIKRFNVRVSSNGKEKQLASTAYSLLGKPYVSGSNGPNAFDCSGFVQYVYLKSGITVSRSASTQLMDGYEVSYDNVQLGDILVWGYDKDHITHTGIYVGDGLMVHAANPNQGVIINNVSTWGNSSNISLVSVRRL